ncbi:MAG: hypothetical protein ACSHXA_07410 [Polaribacter sp.]|jgi:hypothetical protein|uniref:hypothetical protein n=1 Tax=Polaribacter sp. TaxID=1920175 RepID=UPI003EF3BB54
MTKLKNEIKDRDPKFIWKYDSNGNERPLDEQIARREADLIIAKDHIKWYDKNHFYKERIRNVAAQQRRVNHAEGIESDIRKLKLKL